MVSWLWKKSVDEEVGEELDFHLEMRTREHMARGLDPAAARAAALRRFGDIDRVRATCRDIALRRDSDMRRRINLSELRQDVTFALRQLAAHPGFTLVAVLTLALGIGATTAIFSAVNAVVLRPLPVPRADRLVAISCLWKGEPGSVSGGNYTALAEAQRAFSSVAASQWSSFNLSAGEGPERTIGARVTASFFDVFRVPPALGRVFGADEDQPGREQVVVLSHRLWKRRFGADPGIVGRDLRMNGLPYRVLGVMPARFDLTAESEELWVPIAFTPERKAMYDEHYLTVVARLRDGVSPAQAQSDLARIAADLRQSHPEDKNAGREFRIDSFLEDLVGDYGTRLLVLLGAVGLVLLIACGNVANLLLARGAARAREMAIRTALGAGRGRIVRQLLTESAVLALVSGAVGLVLAWWGVRALISLVPPGVPRFEQTALDGTALAFALGLSLLSSLIFGLAPALRAGKNVSRTLKEGGRGSAGTTRDWLRPALVAAEVTLAVLLLVGAGLLIRSAFALQRIEPGFDPAGVMTARVSLPAATYEEPERLADAFGRMVQGISQAPGVRFAALLSQMPMGRGSSTNGLLPEGKADDLENVVNSRLCIVTPELFRALGIRTVRGRAITAADRRGAQRVMMLNEAAAAALFPGQDPIGRRVGCCESDADGSPIYKVVVGVAADVRSRGRGAEVVPEFYLPMDQMPPVVWDWLQRSMFIVVRADRPEALAPALRRAVASVDPDAPLYDVKTMEQRMGESEATARFNMLLLSLLGVVGLLLSAVGIYGVISYFVTQRTAEIGVRMALGATRRSVTGLVMRQAILPVAAGILLGLAASAAATRLLSAYLIGVRSTDPLTLASVVAVLAMAALLASFVPARRAASVEPVEALQG